MLFQVLSRRGLSFDRSEHTRHRKGLHAQGRLCWFFVPVCSQLCAFHVIQWQNQALFGASHLHVQSTVGRDCLSMAVSLG